VINRMGAPLSAEGVQVCHHDSFAAGLNAAHRDEPQVVTAAIR
jgi:hypothetical protein